MDSALGSLFFLVVGLVVVVGVLLVGREVVTWYWKINATLEAMGRMEATLKSIDHSLFQLTQARAQTQPEQKWGVGS